MSSGYSRSTKKKIIRHWQKGSVNQCLWCFKPDIEEVKLLQQFYIERANEGNIYYGEHLQEVCAKMLRKEIPWSDLLAEYMAAKHDLVTDGLKAEHAWNLVNKKRKPRITKEIKQRDARTVFEAVSAGQDFPSAYLTALEQHYPYKAHSLTEKLKGITDKSERAKLKRDEVRSVKKNFGDTDTYVLNLLSDKQEDLPEEAVTRMLRELSKIRHKRNIR